MTCLNLGISFENIKNLLAKERLLIIQYCQYFCNPTQDGIGLRLVVVYKVRGSSARIRADLVLNLVRLELRLASGLIQPV